jgi:hypothetical protein
MLGARPTCKRLSPPPHTPGPLSHPGPGGLGHFGSGVSRWAWARARCSCWPIIRCTSRFRIRSLGVPGCFVGLGALVDDDRVVLYISLRGRHLVVHHDHLLPAPRHEHAAHNKPAQEASKGGAPPLVDDGLPEPRLVVDHLRRGGESNDIVPLLWRTT